MMMSTSLDHLPDEKQQNIRAIVDIIHDEFDQIVNTATKDTKQRSRILLIILFGSYAKGTYVDDFEHGYISDYDILVVLNEPELVEEYKIWHTVEERGAVKANAPVNLIVHTLRELNQQLKQGRYFFKDIRQQGVQLYQYNHTELLLPGRLVREEAIVIAQQQFEQWYSSANEFLEFAELAIYKNYNRKAAFELHQAVERYYSCLLLVFENYRPKSHNIKMLNSLVMQLSFEGVNDFRGILPEDTKFNRRCCQLLKKAYIEARYSEHYKISKEELTWLLAQVKLLKHKTNQVCQYKIDNF